MVVRALEEEGDSSAIRMGVVSKGGSRQCPLFPGCAQGQSQSKLCMGGKGRGIKIPWQSPLSPPFFPSTFLAFQPWHSSCTQLLKVSIS